MESFLCVRTAAASTSAVDRFAIKQLDLFASEFSKWMRSDIRMKAEPAVTIADMHEANIIAFGTPATSKLVARAVGASPIRWNADWIVVGRQKFPASTHILSMIYPNPAAPSRYIVINSGHTFHEADFRGTNALLYPRVGDWAVTNMATGKVEAEGVFNRRWALGPNP